MTTFKLTKGAKAELFRKFKDCDLREPVFGLSYGREKYLDDVTGRTKIVYEGWLVSLFERKQLSEFPNPSFIDLGDFEVEVFLVTTHMQDNIDNKTLDYKDNRFIFT
jgi:hypothetical protein